MVNKDISGQRHRATTRSHTVEAGTHGSGVGGEPGRALPRSEGKGRCRAGRRQTCAAGCCGCGAGSRDRVTLTRSAAWRRDASHAIALRSARRVYVRADPFVPIGGPLLHAGGGPGPCTARRRLQVAAAVSPAILSLRMPRVSVRVGCRSVAGRSSRAAQFRRPTAPFNSTTRNSVRTTHFCAFAVGTTMNVPW